MTLPEDARTDVLKLLRAVQPASLLLAAVDDQLIGSVQSSLNDTRVEIIDAAALCERVDTLPIYDVILLVGIIEQLDRQSANTVIGRLRDLHSHHLFMLVRVGSDWKDLASYWQRTDLLAHGFSLHQHYKTAEGDWRLCRFELDTYKATPEWLNSKYWANPELFGKYRW